jgi:hypothetical protein
VIAEGRGHQGRWVRTSGEKLSTAAPGGPPSEVVASAQSAAKNDCVRIEDGDEIAEGVRHRRTRRLEDCARVTIAIGRESIDLTNSTTVRARCAGEGFLDPTAGGDRFEPS